MDLMTFSPYMEHHGTSTANIATHQILPYGGVRKWGIPKSPWVYKSWSSMTWMIWGTPTTLETSLCYHYEHLQCMHIYIYEHLQCTQGLALFYQILSYISYIVIYYHMLSYIVICHHIVSYIVICIYIYIFSYLLPLYIYILYLYFYYHYMVPIFQWCPFSKDLNFPSRTGAVATSLAAGARTRRCDN